MAVLFREKFTCGSQEHTCR
uniref:Uncharacterized protein n=1 Tax=Anguilla anguilla TaxID=7936 RepID=A0A0E9VW37_ANGAN